MEQTKAGDVSLTLGKPVVVGEGVGHYWFPCAADRFPSGEVMVRWQTCADSDANLVSSSVHAISTDGGATWPVAYETAYGALLRFCRADGCVVGTGFQGLADPPGQLRRVKLHLVNLLEGGRRYVLEPWGVHIEGFPRDLSPSPHKGRWSRDWPPALATDGDTVPISDGVLGTAYLCYEGESVYRLAAIASQDGGRTWVYRSEIAGPDAVPAMSEGPCEATLLRLAGGDLLCVARVGSGQKQPLIRAYSGDEGRTWSRSERIVPFSVYPCLRRLESGVIALSTGRPGVFLWLCADGRGGSWRPTDILAHHNAVLDTRHHITPEKTTAYTQLVPDGPGRLLLFYDRTPFGWKPVPPDSEERSRIYALPIRYDPT
jgi:hypothetical protein